MSVPRNSMLTAPRNGLSIVVGGDDVGEYVMHWNPTGENALVQPGIGIWEAADRSFTWSEADGMGPEWWRPLPSPPEARA